MYEQLLEEIDMQLSQATYKQLKVGDTLRNSGLGSKVFTIKSIGKLMLSLSWEDASTSTGIATGNIQRELAIAILRPTGDTLDRLNLLEENAERETNYANYGISETNEERSDREYNERYLREEQEKREQELMDTQESEANYNEYGTYETNREREFREQLERKQENRDMMLEAQQVANEAQTGIRETNGEREYRELLEREANMSYSIEARYETDNPVDDGRRFLVTYNNTFKTFRSNDAAQAYIDETGYRNATITDAVDDAAQTAFQKSQYKSLALGDAGLVIRV